MTNATLATPLAARRTATALPPWATLGIAFGLLSAAAIALYGPIGVSGTYPRLIGAVLRRVTPGYAAANPYLVKMGSLITTETMLVVGLLIGGFLSSWLGRARGATPTPSPAASSSSSVRVSPAAAPVGTSSPGSRSSR